MLCLPCPALLMLSKRAKVLTRRDCKGRSEEGNRGAEEERERGGGVE